MKAGCRFPLGKILWSVAVALTLASCAEAPAEAPYDETADAAAVVEAALDEARASGKLVLLNFGANWCPDCRAFARAIADPELAAIIGDRFVTAKVDVGNWDRNPDVVDEWGNPIAEGIPALLVVSPDRQILFASKRGQVSTASRMSREALADFFRVLASVADSRDAATGSDPAAYVPTGRRLSTGQRPSFACEPLRSARAPGSSSSAGDRWSSCRS